MSAVLINTDIDFIVFFIANNSNVFIRITHYYISRHTSNGVLQLSVTFSGNLSLSCLLHSDCNISAF